jgi:hypothetical protein
MLSQIEQSEIGNVSAIDQNLATNKLDETKQCRYQSGLSSSSSSNNTDFLARLDARRDPLQNQDRFSGLCSC